MVNSKELRYGNKLLFLGKIVTFENITQFREDGIFWIKTKEVIESKSFHFKPIPLTEEILLKCGFEITRQTEHPNNIWTVYGEECKFELEHITSFYLYDNKCFGTKVQYLHQLQNLYFALTNTELTVNL